MRRDGSTIFKIVLFHNYFSDHEYDKYRDEAKRKYKKQSDREWRNLRANTTGLHENDVDNYVSVLKVFAFRFRME